MPSRVTPVGLNGAKSRQDRDGERKGAETGRRCAVKSRRPVPSPFTPCLEVLANRRVKRDDPLALASGSFAPERCSSPVSGGGGGNRTPVPRHFSKSFYVHSPSFVFSRPSGLRRTGSLSGPSPDRHSRLFPSGRWVETSLLWSPVPVPQAEPDGRHGLSGRERVVRVST